MGKIKIKELLKILGVGVLFSHSIVLYTTFLTAYFNGHRVMVYVNRSGEANIEFIIMPITLVLGLWALYCMYKDV